ncbi:hypothetical protein [Serinicoccus kebangsaanensis]|uniref:hypothetical protein n=1 Tax=Serinicoccus kebangsaanensis TaxID=2602069 RepID=UPI001EE1F7AD|nr:hypothetical protein [Serinicoccus kebangsaanensis]
MPRSNRPRRGGRPRGRSRAGAGPPGDLLRRGVQEVRFAGQVWSVRTVRPNDSGRRYVCPGCQQQVGADVAHTVAWPTEGMQQAENRRHWHTVCWSARERRRPGGSFA